MLERLPYQVKQLTFHRVGKFNKIIAKLKLKEIEKDNN